MAKEDMESTIYEMINKLGGLEKFQSNPFAFIGEVFKHPDLLSKIDALAKTPEMQKQIAESMNNPMFQQMVGNNPLLAGMMENYKNRQAYGDAVDAEIEDDDDDADDEMPEAVGYEYDIPGWAALDWLNPVSNQPFYVPDDADKRVKFADVLEELPEECQERVALIAEKRLEMHVDEAQMSHLESLASKYDLEVMDLMATTGFMGEVCYCATSAMPDDDLCDLAKFALGSLHRRSGYPVASYLTQNLLYLDTFDSIDKEDWENFVWSLSANPMAGRDGNFAATWDDAVVVVTRYFGGILLGAGGLVRAYSHTARIALEAANIITYEQYTELELDCTYSDYQRYLAELPRFGAVTDDTEFSDRVRLLFAVKDTVVDALMTRICELSNGSDTPRILGKRFDYR